MRTETTRDTLERLMVALGSHVRSDGVIFVTGGATAVLYGWRSTTIDVDIKADPEPAGLFEAIAELKEQLDVNVELASPDLFIPTVPGWRERSILIARHGRVTFFHYDPYAQALSKLARRYDRDLRDVEEMCSRGLVRRDRLGEYFDRIEPELVRFPGIDAPTFQAAVQAFVAAPPADTR